ncbi:nucleoside triphosphate hydrolase protein [Wolfiporia cocos MD-104 SS10]|uniref:Nucleoside triphosphate hydrolase protein n=1 Tax=Wolfiporia cocos (strain MD-104) TaxID=742152 RepID=A0A2H3K1Y4_WOLCO|nr:nucleoside triphosphate hydrolase protein [Wolfiporia cocos MD-104 SS10]
MQRTTRSIEQNLIDDNLPPIRMQFMLETALSEDTIQEFLGPHARYPIKIGLSPAYAESGMLAALAMAIDTRSLVVQFHGKQKAERESVKKARALLQSSILCHDDCILYAFDLGPLGTALFYDHGLHMLRGIDVQSACSNSDAPGGNSPLAAIVFALGDKKQAIKSNVRQAFADSSWDAARTAPLVLRAWIASYLPTISDMEEKFNAVKPVNTKDMEDEYLSLIAQITCGDRMLASKKPTEVGNEFNRPRINHSSARMDSERFQTRFVKKSAVTFTVHDDSGAIFQVHGRAVDVQGRSAKIRAEMTLEGKTIISAVSADDQRVTEAERQKAITILLALQGHIDLFENPFLKCIFVPQDEFKWPEEFISSDTIPDVQSDRLNPSQLQAVERMLSTSNSDRIVIIQGPPGTGKTTVIAAFVCSAVAAGMGGIWLVAQTNVAVKNIAEKLAAVNFTDWRLLVSTDFEFGWYVGCSFFFLFAHTIGRHEHLYRDLNRNIIRSHQFKNGPRLLQGASVVLCTLSMLSNPHIKDLSHVVPLTTLVVDEASQIAVQNYIPPLSAFSSFRKMCFIGDDRQCKYTIDLCLS